MLPSNIPLKTDLSDNKTQVSSSNPLSYAFIFVCQKGDLEGQALLLAASLKKYLRCNHELIAAVPIPEEKWGRLSDTTLKLFEKMGVRVAHFENLIIENKPGDLLTNKMYALQIPTNMDKVVFLDSDLLLMREFFDHERFCIPFNAAPELAYNSQEWEKIYGIFGMPVPSKTVKTQYHGKVVPLYFNSGFFAIKSSMALNLSHQWLDTFKKITESGVMNYNLRLREQVSLSVTVVRMGLEYDILENSYNHVMLIKLQDSNLPYFVHNTVKRPPIFYQPIIFDRVQSLVKEYPEMKPFVAQSRWKYYLRPWWLIQLNKAEYKFQQRFMSSKIKL